MPNAGTAPFTFTAPFTILRLHLYVSSTKFGMIFLQTMEMMHTFYRKPTVKVHSTREMHYIAMIMNGGAESLL